jgi:radical SAM superfamily enzyme YgiQ (UPF0313 family)
MKILLVYPEYPDTFWSFKYALKFVSKKAAHPPLGLLTVASLLPGNWDKKVIDLNVGKLKNNDILWADFVFISAMSVQIKSVTEIIERCQSHNKKIVAGGPLFTEEFEKFGMVDHLVLNEAEITLPLFLEDLVAGIPQKIYQTSEFADITQSPSPDYSLINLSKYSSQSIQFSRGCPFNCDFCDITALLGHKSRIKTVSQILTELENIYSLGWKEAVFFVDDNFIGNKSFLKNNLLPKLISWMEEHHNPFDFATEASINLSDDPELMKLMTKAGFGSVFIGIETTVENSLEECNKVQNKNRNLLESVKKVQKSGIEVMGGFIVGFDNDHPSVFKQQIEFIQNSGIISAMIGILNAPTKSKLYRKLHSEGRILDKWTGDNTDSSTNIIPKMGYPALKSGYLEIIKGIYGSKPFYNRVKLFLKDFEPSFTKKNKISFPKLLALLKSLIFIGVIDRDRKYYWRLFFWTIFKRPKLFPLAITYSIYGYHYKKVFEKIN